MADTDDDGFIGMPPGIFDSGTFKLPPKPERPRVEREEIVFVPTTPGMQPAVPEPESVSAATGPADEGLAVQPPAETLSIETRRSFADPADSPYRAPLVAEPAAVTAETPVVLASAPTTLAAASPPTRWRLLLADGTEVAVSGTVLIGRNPAPFDAWPDAALSPVDDTTHSVSKTHAAFEADDSGLWVHDLDSTNGVWVVHGEDVTEVVPGRRVNVPDGSTVELGDYVLGVRRS
ncbi:FHA domain-containing protein [Protaetiibacter intestinalis]|uniref:FHA domain-containing protein n=1 Tax=Protaetiibacter intestinalis TaxID=2419774 RepID=UPI0013004218|nr:FHA domain-containing protein [Protaetiibacter intestinalis]